MGVEEARIDLAERLRIPDMYVELYYRRLEASNTNSIDAGFGFLLPFFDRSQGRISEARAHRTAADAEVRLTRLELDAQLRSAYSRLTRGLRAARAIREQILPRADTVLKAAEARYKAGDEGLADVLLIRRERVSTEIAYFQALRDALEAWAALLPFLARAS